MDIKQFTGLPKSKDEEKEYTEAIKQSILNGTIDPLLALAHIKRMESIVKALTTDDDIDSYLIDEAYKYPKGTIELHNVEFRIQETGVKYLYANCEDVTWIQLHSEIANLKMKMKEREEFLKTIKPDTEVADTKNGIF